MKLTFGPRGVLQIDDARICWKNFKGEGSQYNQEGNRNFHLIIPDEEIAEALRNDTNEFGVGWNVKIRAPRTKDEAPFMHMLVKVKYTERSQPKIYLISGKNRVKLTEETIRMLDDIHIRSVDMDLRPYDGEGRFGPHRTAYLAAMYVTQEVDRFERRFAEEEYPCEEDGEEMY